MSNLAGRSGQCLYAPSVDLILRVDVDTALHQSLHLINVSDGTGLSQTLLQLFIQRCR